MPITDTALRSLKPKPAAFKLADGGGLHVLVTPAGAKHWKLAYRFAGKQKTLSLGTYPYVSIAEARTKREEAKRKLALDVDPAVPEVEANAEISFEEIAREWHDKSKNEWVGSHAQRILWRLEHNVFPEIGNLPLSSIEAVDLLTVVRKVEQRGALDVSKRVLQTCGKVFRYGIATSRCKRDPTGDLRGALEKAPKVKHRAALKVADLHEFLTRLDAYDGDTITRLAITLTLLTFVRTRELRFAVWSEFEGLDGSAPLWRIPAERMKMGEEHIVPLARQAVSVLEQIRTISGDSDRLFPSTGKHGFMSENTMLFGLYRMGYHSKLTVHGFRGTASTVLNERDFNRDHIERQLAHAERDNVRGAYNSAEWLPQRRIMMQWWADFIDSQRI